LVNPDDGVCGDESVIALRQANSDASRKQLRHLICMHPSEWDASDLATRYAAVREPDQPLHDDEKWGKFEEHVQKLAFWTEAGLPERSVWHFHPLQFIRHFRGCHWLSRTEFAQCLPRQSHFDPPTIDWGTACERSGEHYKELNEMTLKYFGYGKERLVNLLAQVYIETGILSVLREYHAGNGKPYGPFYGRGFLQVTWAGNYKTYGEFKNIPSQSGTPVYTDPRITVNSTHPKDPGGAQMRWAPRFDPERLISNRSDRVDASGWYWVAKHFAGRMNMNRAADLPLTPAVVGYISWLINGGGNGYAQRQQFAKYLINVLLDGPLQRGVKQFTYPPFSAALHHHFPPSSVSYTSSMSINYEPQVPADN
jgi:predicted chitinase